MSKMLMGLAGAGALLVASAGVPAVAAPAIPLSGAQEVAPGDRDGHGFFTYEISGTDFCYTLRWSRVATAAAAHVHTGARHTDGPIAIHLSVGDGSGALVSECVAISSDLADAIAENPKGYYVNVHNGDFPGGAIRGQLK